MARAITRTMGRTSANSRVADPRAPTSSAVSAGGPTRAPQDHPRVKPNEQQKHDFTSFPVPSGSSPEGTDGGEDHRPHREEEESGKDEEDQGKEHLDGSTSGAFLGQGPPLPSKV